jgi:hypothetical protein
MSRTIRRTKEKRNGRSHFLASYVTVYVDHWNGTVAMHGTWGMFPQVKLEGAEYDEMFHMFHGDTHKHYGWNLKGSKGSARAHNRAELQKWIQDNDYEPNMLKLIDLSHYHYHA